MVENGHCFVEWKEQFVSKERGNRVVHYFLKDVSGDSVLAVVGTERSVRHMFYVVSEEFLNICGAENSIQAGYRWRSRREVVNWLTSMLSKQHRQELTKSNPAYEVHAQPTHMPDYKSRAARNLKGHPSDIVWSGVAWTCGKQLRHYPVFCRNGTSIAIQSFAFVMAEEENRYLAYLEDMYEDRKGQKKVRVRWFHHNQEVKGVITLRNPHPKEVFITPYAQVISAECIDGPAIVLTREHYEKCEAVLPNALLARAHLCFRQFRGNRVKPFKLSKLSGYFDQPIFSCFNPDFFEDEDLSAGDNVKLGAKRARSCRGPQMMTYERSYQKFGLLSRRIVSRKCVKGESCNTTPFKVNEKIELLCQDSGIRGCWFRCTVLEVSRKQTKVRYDDVKDEDGLGNLEEWVPSFRLAMPDKLGMRCSGRPTTRPAQAHPSHDKKELAFEIGAPVDAWWSDGWWEGVVTRRSNCGDENLQVCIPSENLLLNIPKRNLRVSRDWVGSRWVDIEANPDVLSAISASISPDVKLSGPFISAKEVKSTSPLTCLEVFLNSQLDTAEDEKLDLPSLAPSNDPPEQVDQVNDEKQPLIEDNDTKDINNVSNDNDNKDVNNDVNDDRKNDNERDDNVDDNNGAGDEDANGDKLEVEVFETDGKKFEELVEVAA